MNEKSIDIVIPWVDSSDPKWIKERGKYTDVQLFTSDAREIRFRDWDNLQFLFRGIERYAPWVRKVHFLTYGHLPSWLNTANPKLNIVNHKEFIPEEFLPTFSSHVIELNMHRIKGLSQRFIYFNDDIFIINHLSELDFFKDELPCDSLASTLIIPKQGTFHPILFNTVSRINKHFTKASLMKKRPTLWFNTAYKFDYMFRSLLFMPWKEHIGFVTHHLAVPYNKSTLETVWEAENEILTETCRHRFRDDRDVNQYIFRYWQLASGNFYPHRLLGKMFTNQCDPKVIVEYIRKRKGKLICINDNNPECDFEAYKHEINSALEMLFPEKCSFEI